MSRFAVVLFSSLLLAAATQAQSQTNARPGPNVLPSAPVNQVQESTTKAATPPPAVAACESKAVDKDGKPLAGAAKSAFVKKCTADAKG
ncbi:MAG: hypothetical protein JWN73_594 [Betaproteobacteria bacterium]|nr:hypothetical protein [Betaproteobacteria bacterium]